ncbi:TPA: hypothetical protein EYP26_04145 [Candidatus Bathyarchaeota archaeon]|nr:hypothetical protein [Candidatus Bathyarchaeota archaeon]
MHKKYLKAIEEKYSNEYEIITVPMQPYEVRGIDNLYRFSKLLEGLPKP